jgi:hypothetical protein
MTTNDQEPTPNRKTGRAASAASGKTLTSGWVCLDGGDEACDSHIVIEEGGE